MPMSPGATRTSGAKGTTRKASAKARAGKVNRRAKATIKALKHGTFSSSGYKPKKKTSKLKRRLTMPMSPGATRTSGSKKGTTKKASAKKGGAKKSRAKATAKK